MAHLSGDGTPEPRNLAEARLAGSLTPEGHGREQACAEAQEGTSDPRPKASPF